MDNQETIPQPAQLSPDSPSVTPRAVVYISWFFYSRTASSIFTLLFIFVTLGSRDLYDSHFLSIVFLIAISVLSFITARGLRKGNSWARYLGLFYALYIIISFLSETFLTSSSELPGSLGVATDGVDFIMLLIWLWVGQKLLLDRTVIDFFRTSPQVNQESS